MLLVVESVLEQSFIGCSSEFGQRSLVGCTEAETYSTADNRLQFLPVVGRGESHQAGQAYVSFAMTTALKTPSRASLFSPRARKTHKAWKVCAFEAMTLMTCWLTERRSENVTPRTLIVCTRVMSGRAIISFLQFFFFYLSKQRSQKADRRVRSYR